MLNESEQAAELMTGLEQLRETYRREHLNDRLTTVASTMEDSMLQAILAQKLLEKEITISAEAKARVQELKDWIEDSEFEEVESYIDGIEEIVDHEKSTIENSIAEARSRRKNTVQAMILLNDRVERYNSENLEELAAVFDTWDWRSHVLSNDTDSFEAARDQALQFAERMSAQYDEAQEELFGPYRDTSLWGILQPILKGERFTYKNLTDEQREELYDSELADFVVLHLS